MADSALKRLAGMRKPGRWFLDALEGVQESKGVGRNDPGWFHPSSLSHPCDAHLAFKFLGVPGQQFIGARLQRIFDLGNARDEQLKRDAKKSGVSLIQSEAERKIVIPNWRIRGEIDDLVENPLTHERFIIDYKTMNPAEWEALQTVKPDHHIQVHPYQFGKEVYQALILYENKGNQEQKIMPAHYKNQTWAEITSRIERIIDGLRKGFVNRTPIPNDSSCPFYYMCSFANIEQLKEKSGIDF